MGESYWENGEWTARYITVDTPFGILTRLVPGTLKRKENPRTPKEPEGSRAERSGGPAAWGEGEVAPPR